MRDRQFLTGFAAGAFVGAILGASFYAWLVTRAPVEDRSKHAGPPEPLALPPPELASEGPALAEPLPSIPPQPPPRAVAPGAAVPATPRRDSAMAPAEPPPQRADALSPAHARLLAPRDADATPVPPSVPQLHDRFSAEARDDRWAYEAESRLNAYLGPAAAERGFDLAGIACRETVCEIQASGAMDRADEVWSGIVHGIYGQPWGREFTGISSQSEGKDNRTVILTILTRADAP